MAGKQNATNGKCPDGYVHVFGPLCIEQDTLQKIDDALPDLPKFDFTNIGCESALAAYKSVLDTVNQALESPLKLMEMARNILEKPFDAAQDMVNSALGIFDNINSAIDDILSGTGGFLDPLKEALEKVLSCPFLADTDLGKQAAGLLDAIDVGNPITELLSGFKDALQKTASDQINKVKELPLSAIGNLEKLYQDTLSRLGVEDLIKKAMAVYQCVQAACEVADLAKKTIESPPDILGKINGFIDESTGKLTSAFVKSGNQSVDAAKKMADSISVVRLAKRG